MSFYSIYFLKIIQAFTSPKPKLAFANICISFLIILLGIFSSEIKSKISGCTKEEIIIKLSTIVKPYIQNEEGFKNISEDTDFMNDLEINSANLVDIVLDVEDEFNIIIDNDSMDKMLTIKSVVEIIKEKQSSE